jgi:hypothetical protein
MSRLLEAVAGFCTWSGMRIKREKSVITGFDYKERASLFTESILYEGSPLTGLSADEAFAYLGVRASLAACLPAERRPRADPMKAHLIRACGQLQAQIKLPACFSLGVAGRDTSWQALLMHLRMQASAPGASQQLLRMLTLQPRHGQPSGAAFAAEESVCHGSFF